MPILAVNVLAVNSLAVNGALHALYSVKKVSSTLHILTKSVLDTLCSVKKCLIDSLSVLFEVRDLPLAVRRDHPARGGLPRADVTLAVGYPLSERGENRGPPKHMVTGKYYVIHF